MAKKSKQADGDIRVIRRGGREGGTEGRTRCGRPSSSAPRWTAHASASKCRVSIAYDRGSCGLIAATTARTYSSVSSSKP
jgi:hypothetical protein